MDEFMKRKEEYEEKIASDEGLNTYIALMSTLKSKTLRNIVHNPQTIQEVRIADGIVSIGIDFGNIILKSKSVDVDNYDYDSSTLVEYLNKFMIAIMNIKKGWNYSNDDIAVLFYEGCKTLVFKKTKQVGAEFVIKHPLTIAKFAMKTAGSIVISTIRGVNNKTTEKDNDNDRTYESDSSSNESAQERVAAFIDDHQEEIYEYLASPDGEKSLTTFEEVVHVFHELYQKDYEEKQTGYQYQKKLS